MLGRSKRNKVNDLAGLGTGRSFGKEGVEAVGAVLAVKDMYTAMIGDIGKSVGER